MKEHIHLKLNDKNDKNDKNDYKNDDNNAKGDKRITRN